MGKKRTMATLMTTPWAMWARVRRASEPGVCQRHERDLGVGREKGGKRVKGGRGEGPLRSGMFSSASRPLRRCDG